MNRLARYPENDLDAIDRPDWGKRPPLLKAREVRYLCEHLSRLESALSRAIQTDIYPWSLRDLLRQTLTVSRTLGSFSIKLESKIRMEEL